MSATVADGEPERLTFDTNALVLLLTNSARLTEPARAAATGRERVRLFSAASVYEVAFKARLGKLPIDPTDFRRALGLGGFTARSVTEHLMYAAATLEWTNRDPWDRIIGATARHEGGRLVSSDAAFDEVPGIVRIW